MSVFCLHTVSGCRVLKNVNIDKAPLLAQSSFVQCPKIRYEDVVDEICQLPPEEHRIIYLRPVGKVELNAAVNAIGVRHRWCCIFASWRLVIFALDIGILWMLNPSAPVQ